MAQATAYRLSMYALMVAFLLATSGSPSGAARKDGDEGKVKKPKTVTCDSKKKYPACYNKGPQQCPSGCPNNCKMDCVTCTAYCKPKSVTCTKIPGYQVCNPKTIQCKDDCPLSCNVDCIKCKPYCGNPRSPPSHPPSPPPRTAPPPPYTHPTTTPPPSTPPPSPTPSTSPPPNQTPSPSPPPTPSTSPPPTPTPSPSPPPPTPTPSPPPVSFPVTATCNNMSYPHCYGEKLACPSDCPDHCEVDCRTCKALCGCNKPGAVCQDPRFIGGDGLTFYFHGQKDRDFCIVSDSNLHINAHFIGRRNSNMKRDFTWVQSLGILFGTHKLYVGAMKTATWDDSVDRLALAFDGEPVYLPDKQGSSWQSATSQGSVTISRARDTNSVTIEAENNFKIKASVVAITEKDSAIHNYGVTREDCLAHLDLSFKFYSLSGRVSGVLGQTYASNYVSRVKVEAAMPVVGGGREFGSSSLFVTDCSASRFVVGGGDEKLALGDGTGYGDLECSGELNGLGVVCKR